MYYSHVWAINLYTDILFEPKMPIAVLKTLYNAMIMIIHNRTAIYNQELISYGCFQA